MGQVLHSGGTTTAAICRAVQHSQESLRGLAKRYGINLKTVAKWRARTSVQVKRTNRILKEATVKRLHYDIHDQLRAQFSDFVNAYNFGRRLKTLRGLTPCEAIRKAWTAEPKRFTLNPLHQMPALNRQLLLSRQ